MVGLWIGRRHYPLSKIGKGLLLTAMVAGVIGGCFAWVMGIAGKRVVDTDIDFKRTSIANDSQSMADRRAIHLAVDTLTVRLVDLQEQVALVGLVSCAQLKTDTPDWLREKCRVVLSKGAPR